MCLGWIPSVKHENIICLNKTASGCSLLMLTLANSNAMGLATQTNCSGTSKNRKPSLGSRIFTTFLNIFVMKVGVMQVVFQLLIRIPSPVGM